MSDRDVFLANLLQTSLDEMMARYDAVAGMPEIRTEAGSFHAARESVSFARCLLDAQGRAAVPMAARAISAALTAQERRPDNIHYGNFKWMNEDRGVTDLNSVQFVMENLIPVYQDYHRLFDADLKRQILDSMRPAMIETQNLDVSVAYTNIVLLSIMNAILGGETLHDDTVSAWGRRKLEAWIAFTNRSGTVTEYNSPNYAAVDIVALADLAERTRSREVAIQARLMEERLWLHVAAHFHPNSFQVAGPHNRAYHNDVTGGMGAVKHMLNVYLRDDRLMRPSPYFAQRQTRGYARALRPLHLPDYIERLILNKPYPYTVSESANVDRGVHLTTFMRPSYALGSCSTDVHNQSNRLILYYRRQAAPGYGVAYTRFIINDKVIGSVYHASARTRMANLYEEGDFWAVQERNKVIVLRALLPQTENLRSVKSEIIIPGSQNVSIRVNGKPVAELPCRLQPLDVLTLADEDVYIGVRPLTPTNMGDEAPIILERRDHELVLSLYNYYQGEEKRFWEYSSLAGHFYKGNIKAGFVFEAGDRDEYGNLEHFSAHMAQTHISDQMDGALRHVSYATGGDLMEITVDLLSNHLVERRVNGQVVRPAMLASPTAVQSTSGHLEAGAAVVDGGTAPLWMVSNDAHDCWAVVNPSDNETPVRLSVPGAMITSPAFGFGKIVCRGRDTVSLEIVAVRQTAPVTIHATCNPVKVTWNGRDVTERLAPAGGVWVLPVLE